MRKTIKAIVITASAMILLTGCSSSSNELKINDQETSEQQTTVQGEPVTKETVSEKATEDNTKQTTTQEATIPPVDSNVKDEFSDSVFIGDSRTEGLCNYAIIPKATFFANVGLNVKTAITNKSINLDNGTKGTVLDALAQHQYKRVFVMYGVNELGWNSTKVFQERYEELLKKIKSSQPNAKIYVQSILPVSDTKKDNVYNNPNVDKFNTFVKAAAENTGCTYVDLCSKFKNANGGIPDSASKDGVHYNKEYCKKWVEYLKILVD